MTEPAATTIPARVLLADDEPLALRVLHDLFAPLRDFEVVAECRDGREALAAISEHRPECVILDIRMPHIDGMQLLRLATSQCVRMPQAIVFTTAYDTYAVQAFEVDAVDYLLKPFTDDRFAATIRRVRRFLRHGSADEPGAQVPADSRIRIGIGGRSIFVRIADIDWVAADGYCSRVNVGSRSYVIRRSLTELRIAVGRLALCPSECARSNRSHPGATPCRAPT